MPPHTARKHEVTREHKLALVVGFSLVLVVGVLISDHFSKARAAKIAGASVDEPVVMPAALPTPAPSPQNPTIARADRPIDESPVIIPDPARTTAPDIIDMGPKPTLVSNVAPNGAGTLGVGPLTATANVHTDPGSPQSDPIDPWARSTPDAPASRPQAPSLPVTRGTLQRYDVVKGDNIGKIADRYYGDRNLWKPLQAYNKTRVSPDGIMRTGVTLLIPPKDVVLGLAVLPPDAKAGAPGAPPAKESDKPRSSAPDKPKSSPGTIYTVQAGDTLSKIAEKQLGSKSKWEQIRDLNADTLEDEDTLTQGQKLKLPAKQ